MDEKKKQKLREWAKSYNHQVVLCREKFQSRADNVIDTSKAVRALTPLGPIHALNVCMQIEEEFPGRVEEVIEKAFEYDKLWRIGFVATLIHVIRKERAK